MKKVIGENEGENHFLLLIDSIFFSFSREGKIFSKVKSNDFFSFKKK